MINMKPYDPEHKGEFCFETRDNFERILCTDSPGDAPIKVLTTEGNVQHCDAQGVCIYIEDRIMCVIPKREARVMTYAGIPFREVMPDDISQEKARTVIEAGRMVCADARNIGLILVDTPCGDAIVELRAALGDDA